MSWFRVRKHRPYRTAQQYAENKASQVQMSPQTVLMLYENGATESSSLSLEVFFYTDSMSKAEALTHVLLEKEYEVSASQVESTSPKYLVNGWSPKMLLDRQTVVEWTEQMCDLGAEHDALFDGWGACPD